MSITPRILETIKTVFFHAIKDNSDNNCRLCKQPIDFAAAQLSPDDFEAPEAWRGPGGDAVPWHKVANGWMRAAGHHPECPLKELADLVLSLEQCFDEELTGEAAPPAPPTLDAHTMARAAMHFRGWSKNRGVELVRHDQLSHTEADGLIADYEEALGGTPDRDRIDSGAYLYDEYYEGEAARPLGSSSEDV